MVSLGYARIMPLPCGIILQSMSGGITNVCIGVKQLKHHDTSKLAGIMVVEWYQWCALKVSYCMHMGRLRSSPLSPVVPVKALITYICHAMPLCLQVSVTMSTMQSTKSTHPQTAAGATKQHTHAGQPREWRQRGEGTSTGIQSSGDVLGQSGSA